jgi:antirestriction protein ArdC
MPTQNQIRESITNQILEALKSGDLPPWRRPWALDRNAGAPVNIVSKKQYRGINPLLLAISSMKHGFQSQWWATFNQWKELGGSVMRRPHNVPRGQWGTNIVFWRPVTKTETDANGEEQEDTYFLLKTYTVFCIDQVEGDHLDHLRVGHEDAKLDAEEVQQRFDAADAAIEATEADIRHGGNRAAYNPAGDFIVLPHRHQFSLPEYYETAFHELSHWTEHRSRLDCDRSQSENSYAFMELRAELGGCFIAAELGLPTAERLENHASYLKSWLEKMQDDPKFIFRAAAQAAKAADYVLSFSRQPVEEPEAVV